MSGSLSSLQPELRPFAEELVNAAGASGLQPRVTSTRRTYAQQKALYDRYLRGEQQYPVARPGTSAHEFGWAFDMVVTPMDYLIDVGYYWIQMGGVWGGRPTRSGSGYDPVHFEYPGWRSLVDFTQEAKQSQFSVVDVVVGAHRASGQTASTFETIARETDTGEVFYEVYNAGKFVGNYLKGLGWF